MTRHALDLPIDIPWKLIAVSPDMMDTAFGNKAYPFAFRTALAISAFEPSVDDLPDGICDERLTYLKVSATVTGYQPSKEETDQGQTEFPNVPNEELTRLLNEYFGCYGVLLNVAVFPRHRVITEVERVCDKLATLKPGEKLANPLVRGDVTYRAAGREQNVAVDTYPIGGDGTGELDIGTQLTVTFPAGGGVAAYIAQRQPAPRDVRTCINFASLAPKSQVPNPYTNGGVAFITKAASQIAVVDLDPPAGDGRGELDLTDGVEVRFPAAKQVDAKIVQLKQDKPDFISMRAFRQGQQVGSATATAAEGVQVLTVAAEGIDSVVFRVPEPRKGSLVEFCRTVSEAVAPQPVTIDVYAGDDLLETKTAGGELGRVDTLTIEGENVDRAVIKAPTGNASLLQFCHFVPHERPVKLEDYPHIVDFEPKSRDLYQAATLQGEVLTASRGDVKTDKSMSHTESSQTGLSLGATYTTPPTPYGSASVNGSLSHTWGETSTDAFSVVADNSRERRERQGTTTNLNQMYNLLTGYHLGTNRASFVMLPRPHMLQPTDHRTFVKGLRMIEGVQDFFLVVRRPEGIDGICVEAKLDTGHFPEKVDVETPDPVYDTGSDDFTVSIHANSGTVGAGETKNIQDQAASVYNLSSGWVVDRTKGDAGHLGVSEIAVNDNQQSKDSLRAYDYRPTSDGTVQVFGTIEGAGWWGPGAIFERTYRVFRRSQNPKPADDNPVVTSPFFISTRSLQGCLLSSEHCVKAVAPEPWTGAKSVDGGRSATTAQLAKQAVEVQAPATTALVQERRLELDPRVVVAAENADVMPAVKELLTQIHNALSTSWRAPGRQPDGETLGFLDTDYFKDRVVEHVPEEQLEAPIADAPAVPAEVAKALGPETTVREALAMDLPTFAARTGLDASEAARARANLLRGGE